MVHTAGGLGLVIESPSVDWLPTNAIKINDPCYLTIAGGRNDDKNVYFRVNVTVSVGIRTHVAVFSFQVANRYTIRAQTLKN